METSFLLAFCAFVLIVILCFVLKFKAKILHLSEPPLDVIKPDFVIDVLVSVLDYGVLGEGDREEVEFELRKQFFAGRLEQKRLVKSFIQMLRLYPDVDWNILSENIRMAEALSRSLRSKNECVGNFAVRTSIMLEVFCQLQEELKAA